MFFFFFAFFPKSLSDGLRWNERDFAASVITERVLIFASNVQYPFFITGCLVPLSKPPVMWTKPQQQTPQSSHQNGPVSQGCSNSAKSPLQKKEITEKSERLAQGGVGPGWERLHMLLAAVGTSSRSWQPLLRQLNDVLSKI